MRRIFRLFMPAAPAAAARPSWTLSGEQYRQVMELLAEIGLAMVSGDTGHLADVLDRCERLVAGRPEVELLSVRRRLHGDED